MSRWTRRELLRTTAASAAVAVPAVAPARQHRQFRLTLAARFDRRRAGDVRRRRGHRRRSADGVRPRCRGRQRLDPSRDRGDRRQRSASRRQDRPRQVRRQEGLKELAMSSHREAPEISKDPVADSTDTYAFVSTNPAEAGTVTLITNYIPARGSRRRPELLRVRRRRAVPHQRRQQRRRLARRDVRVHVPDRVAQAQLPLQHRADRGARQRQLEPPPVRQRHRGARHQPHGARRAAAAAAVQHRAAFDAQLRRPRRPRRPTTSATGSASSPASASTVSTSTSGRCSTSAPCGRSRTST